MTTKTIIFENGEAKTIYSDEVAKTLKSLGKATVTRASNVEWEEGGWTVRAAHNPLLAIRKVKGRQTVSENGKIVKFTSREQALKREVALFWDIIPKD